MDFREIENSISKLKGKKALFYKNMITKQSFSVNGEESFHAASLIKLPVLMAIYERKSRGLINLSDKIVVKDREKVNGAGAIKSFPGDVEIDIETLCKLMITISDNTAANVLIRNIGIDELSEDFKNMGLDKTKIQRCFYDEEACRQGKNNYICPIEIGSLLEKIYKRTFVNQQVSTEIENILLDQQIRYKIPGRIGESKKIANKTGETDLITHDGAIVYAKKPFILVVSMENGDVSQGDEFIRIIAKQFFDWNNI